VADVCAAAAARPPHGLAAQLVCSLIPAAAHLPRPTRNWQQPQRHASLDGAEWWGWRARRAEAHALRSALRCMPPLRRGSRPRALARAAGPAARVRSTPARCREPMRAISAVAGAEGGPAQGAMQTRHACAPCTSHACLPCVLPCLPCVLPPRSIRAPSPAAAAAQPGRPLKGGAQDLRRGAGQGCIIRRTIHTTYGLGGTPTVISRGFHEIHHRMVCVWYPLLFPYDPYDIRHTAYGARRMAFGATLLPTLPQPPRQAFIAVAVSRRLVKSLHHGLTRL
jgi:hypothetical protein